MKFCISIFYRPKTKEEIESKKTSDDDLSPNISNKKDEGEEAKETDEGRFRNRKDTNNVNSTPSNFMAVSWKKETNSSVVTLIPKFNTERAVISNVSERRPILLHPERRCKIGCNSSIG